MFADISHALPQNPAARHRGVTVADIDGDGRFEFAVARTDGPNRVLKWARGQLYDAAPPELAAPDRPTGTFAAADVDGDGEEELYAVSSDDGSSRGADQLLKRLPDGRWEDLFARPENRAARGRTAGGSVAAVDRRGVGRYGFAVTHPEHPLRFCEQAAGGRLADLAPALRLARPGAGRGVLAAPLFDSHTDLLCVTESGPNALFRNRGDGTFEECAGPFGLADDGEPGQGVATLDAGGRFALCVGSREGPHRVMVPRRDGRWLDHATAGVAFPSAVRTLIAADFDNDGSDELFFNNHGEPNRLFSVRDGAGGVNGGCPELVMIEPGAALEPLGFGTGAAVADIDGDGVLELLVAHGESGGQPLSLFRSRTAVGNNRLRVRPKTRFGAPARGAVVQIEYAGRVRRRVIDGGSGSWCQMEPVAHFGLGKAERVDRVTVTWPDGATISFDDPDLNHTYAVDYPCG